MVYLKTIKNTFLARFPFLPFALDGSMVGVCLRSNRLLYIVW